MGIRPPPIIPTGEYAVQVAAFNNEPNAINYATQLQERGYPAEVLHFLNGDVGPLYRVVFGHFQQREQAHHEASIFAQKENSKALILERS